MHTDSGYAARPVTKPPNWHGLVVLDVLFNNLTTGLFVAAALAELAAPEAFAAVAKVAYPAALALLVVDLVLLVADLGDPLRFHHMLRVFKPSSPMSLGTWCLTAYSLPLTVLAAISLLGGAPAWMHWLAVLAGLPAALGAAVYKGVLFSTSSQPGWKDARWLGGYLTNSALLLGCAQLLTLSIGMGQERAAATLRHALLLLLPLNVATLGLLLADVRASLSRAYTRAALVRLAVLVLGDGVLIPLGLFAAGGPVFLLVAAVLVVLGALVVRVEVVRLPHVLSQGKGADH
jgi:hypothetical protein